MTITIEQTVRLAVSSNTAVYGGNEYGKSGHLFLLFEALNDALEV